MARHLAATDPVTVQAGQFPEPGPTFVPSWTSVRIPGPASASTASYSAFSRGGGRLLFRGCCAVRRPGVASYLLTWAGSDQLIPVGWAHNLLGKIRRVSPDMYLTPLREDMHLTSLEAEMVAAAVTGEPVHRGEGPFKPAEMQAWGKERTVRAAVLRHLLIKDQWPVDARGVRLRGVRISGVLDLKAATLRCPLSLDGCYFDGNEPVCFDYATTSLVELTGCQLPGLAGDMLSGKELDLTSSTFRGPLRLRGAKITGVLNCSGATLIGRDEDGDALVADGVTVGGDVFLTGKFTAIGAIRLAGAKITGGLNCSGATLIGRDEDGDALVADGVTVGGNVFLDETLAVGSVRLAGAKITGVLSCRGAILTGHAHARDEKARDALVAFGMTVGGDVFLDEGFAAARAVFLVSAHIEGSVYLEPAQLAGDENTTAFIAARAQIASRLYWRPRCPVLGQVNLEGAAVGELKDDWINERAHGYWPTNGRLRLNGFTYTVFAGAQQATVKQRLAWIRSQYKLKPAVLWVDTLLPPVTIAASDNTESFASQPYEQLAAVYGQAGQDTEARKVAIARRTDLRKYGDLNSYRRLGNWFLQWSIGYGYRTWRAGLALAGLFVAIAVLAYFAQQHHLMMPVGNTDGLHFVPSATRCTSSYPCFSPIGYAVDTVIPVINVHQADYWGPDAHTTLGPAWAAVTRFATVLGWALATLLVAGYTGLVRRD